MIFSRFFHANDSMDANSIIPALDPGIQECLPNAADSLLDGRTLLTIMLSPLLTGFLSGLVHLANFTVYGSGQGYDDDRQSPESDVFFGSDSSQSKAFIKGFQEGFGVPFYLMQQGYHLGVYSAQSLFVRELDLSNNSALLINPDSLPSHSGSKVQSAMVIWGDCENPYPGEIPGSRENHFQIS